MHNFFFFLCVKLFFLEKTQMYLINRLKNVFAGDFLKTLRKKIIFCVKRIEKKNISGKKNICETDWKIFLRTII